MRKSLLRQVTLYNHRYTFGVMVFLALLIAVLVFRLDLAPTGLTSSEMQSSVTSATWNISQPLSQPLIDAPYHLLQKLSLSVLGLNEWGIIAPSLLLGLVTGLAFVLMVQRWFKLNVALIAGLIFISSAAFLTLARTGTPMIMTTFWLSIILLAATNILHPESRSRLWGPALLLAVPLSLYTPLMIYPLIAIGIAGLLHPHVRFMARKMKNLHYVLAVIVIITLLGPLVASIVADPQQLYRLFGIPETSPSMREILTNLSVIATSFFSIGSTQVGFIPQPIFGAASLILILLGLIKTLVDRYSARSYMLLLWSLFFIPIAILNPNELLICLIPAYLFMAIGIETLIREWYKLFPLNPYARLAGLIPLTVLLGGIIVSNSAQYFYGYFYGTPKERYSEQLRATNDFIKNTPQGTKITVVTISGQASFYDLLRRDHDNVAISIAAAKRPAGDVIIHQGATYAPGEFGAPTRIVASYKKASDQVIAREFRQ